MLNDQLNTNEYLSNCHLKDVLSFKGELLSSIGNLKNIIFRAFRNSGINSIANYIANESGFKNTKNIGTWFYEGQECEILKAGSQGWQKGKIKINVTLEFIPDEPEVIESPLDDVRQEIDKSNP
jgi:hypothetical protein